MKKELLLRGLLGIPLGIAIGHLITVFSSLFWGTGAFYPCMPAFAAQVGSEAQAVLLQTALCGLVAAEVAHDNAYASTHDGCGTCQGQKADQKLLTDALHNYKSPSKIARSINIATYNYYRPSSSKI